MANTIQIKRGEDINNAPALFDGELAFDQKDDQLYIGKNGEKIQVAPSKQEHDALLQTTESNFNSLAKYFSVNGNPIIPTTPYVPLAAAEGESF